MTSPIFHTNALPSAAPADWRDPRRWRQAGVGFFLGLAIVMGIRAVGINGLFPFMVLGFWLPMGLLGAWIGTTRARFLLWWVLGALAIVYGIVAWTPLAGQLVHQVTRADPIRQAEAVVVLSGDIHRDGSPTPQSQARLARAFELLMKKESRQLVLTRLPPSRPSYQPWVRRQLAERALDVPIAEVGPVWNTQDEAIEVARLARQRGWKTVLLVSDPTHLRRAHALFEKQGLHAICAPGRELDFDPDRLVTRPARLAAFRRWLHETYLFGVAWVLGRI